MVHLFNRFSVLQKSFEYSFVIQNPSFSAINNVSSAIAGKQDKNLKFENVSASSWASDTEFTDYPYKCTIALSGVDSNDYAEVVFGVTEATSGNYAPICRTYNGGVYIWGKENTVIAVNVIVEVF